MIDRGLQCFTIDRITPELTPTHLHCAACGFVSFQKYHVRFRGYLLFAGNLRSPVIQRNTRLLRMGIFVRNVSLHLERYYAVCSVLKFDSNLTVGGRLLLTL